MPDIPSSSKPATPDPWTALRRHTPARIALGRAGSALPTAELLAFGLAHARARDAVHHPLDVEKLRNELSAIGFDPRVVSSAAPDRATYLTRPDLGRRLKEGIQLSEGSQRSVRAEVVVSIEDGLSAIAVQHHVVPLLKELAQLDPLWRKARAVVATQARVALGDEIGQRLGARLVVVLIGERPGLSSPDSLGAYLTFAPRVGRTDAERNCVSNIRPEGLGYAQAARKIDWLARAALSRGLTGVALKDESALEPKKGSEQITDNAG